MENTNIGGWRAFFEGFEQFFLNKFYEYTTTKDGMEIWVLYQFYTPLLMGGMLGCSGLSELFALQNGELF